MIFVFKLHVSKLNQWKTISESMINPLEDLSHGPKSSSQNSQILQFLGTISVLRIMKIVICPSIIAWNRILQIEHIFNIFVYFLIFMSSNINSTFEKHNFQKIIKTMIFDLPPTICPKEVTFSIKCVVFYVNTTNLMQSTRRWFEYDAYLLIFLYQFRSSILRIVTKSLKKHNFYTQFTIRKNHNFKYFWSVLCVSPLIVPLSKCYKS